MPIYGQPGGGAPVASPYMDDDDDFAQSVPSSLKLAPQRSIGRAPPLASPPAPAPCSPKTAPQSSLGQPPPPAPLSKADVAGGPISGATPVLPLSSKPEPEESCGAPPINTAMLVEEIVEEEHRRGPAAQFTATS